MGKEMTKGRAGSTRGYGRADYVHGSAAKQVKSAPAGTPQGRRNLTAIRGGLVTEKPTKRMNITHLCMMLGALLLMALVLYRYVSIQSALEGSVTTISALERELASMKQENDEAYSRANATVDLEEVKRIAIQELGMKYADQGQIVVYSDEGAEDYVRQVALIPEAGEK